MTVTDYDDDGPVPPGTCQAITVPAQRLPYNEPAEYCEADAEPGQDYCAGHLGDDEWW